MNKKLFDTSTSSLDQDDIHNEERHIQNFTRQMLKGRLFMGIFHEKRFVETLSAYRDVVSVSKDERNLIRDLVVVKNRIEGYYSKDHWTGITTPDMVGAPANHCIWVELPQDQIFGCYWFKIKTVKFKEREAFVRVQVIRSVDTPHNLSSGVYSKAHTTEQNINNNEMFDFNLVDLKQYFKNNLKYFVNNVATARNIKEIVVFTCVMLVTAVTGSFQLLQFFCDFLLKFMREVSNFTRSATPIFIALINLVGKTISGLYMLIAYMWKDKRSPAPEYNSYHAISDKPLVLSDYGQRPVYYQRALPSSGNGRGVVITEIS